MARPKSYPKLAEIVIKLINLPLIYLGVTSAKIVIPKGPKNPTKELFKFSNFYQKFR